MFMKNIDILTMINYFIGSFICCFGMMLTGMIFLKKKFTDIKKLNFLLLIPLSILIIFNSLTFDNIVKIFGSLIVFYMIYFFALGVKSKTCIIYSVISYITFIISEVIVMVITSTIGYLFKIEYIDFASKSILVNIIIVLCSCYLAKLFKNKINNFVNKVNKSNLLIIAIQGVILILVTVSSINHIYINDWELNYDFFLNVVIVLGSIILIFYFIKEYLKNKEIVSKYSLLDDYLKTSADVVEKYSSTVHKYKNNLISIQGYLKTDVKQANKYVDNLLEDYKNKKYSWFSKINYIKNDAFRYLVYYKLNKAEEKNLKLSVTVSKELKKIEINYLNVQETGIVLDILGELLDNATYAASESSSKELILDMYKEDNYITVEIANTYSNDFDLNSITKSGYTTKGKGHGLGLYEIDKSVKKLDFLTINYEKVDKYFIVKLLMKIDKNL